MTPIIIVPSTRLASSGDSARVVRRRQLLLIPMSLVGCRQVGRTPRHVPRSVKDAFTDLLDRACGGHAEQQALLVVVIEQRTGRAGEYL
jgi:hypothetical protein